MSDLRHWVMGELDSAGALVSAAVTMRSEGIRVLDTHSPEPVEVNLPASRIGGAAGVGGIAAAAAGILATDAVFDAAPVVLALALLVAAVSTVLALIIHYWGFPRLHHPLFDNPAFSTTGYWISVNADTEEKVKVARERLEKLGAKNISVVDGGYL